MSETFDAIVLGSGVVGASTAFHLSKLGGLKVCVVERGEPCSGGTAKSCAIVRSHYSVPSNTALTLASLEIFAGFKAWLEDDEADPGFVNSGYLILAPDGELAEKMRVNLAMQSGAGAETFEVSAAEALERHPLLALDGVALIGFEPRSGYADPYLTTTGFLKAARRRGAVIRTTCPAERLILNGDRISGVATATGVLSAGLVVSALGPWTRQMTDPLGLEIPLEISRHTVLTFRGRSPYRRDLPVVKDLTTANKMYFRPATGGVVLLGTGDHGDPLLAADDIDEVVKDDFVLLQGGQLARRLTDFDQAAPTASWVGAYDITPDWNPVLGPVAGIEGLILAYGFSGHGFKLAPALGKVLAQSALGLAQDVDLRPYRLSRFGEGELLTGSYGIGSIS
jgi:glycine/D-amino acid oxidase-like deaminating enzyme